MTISGRRSHRFEVFLVSGRHEDDEDNGGAIVFTGQSGIYQRSQVLEFLRTTDELGNRARQLPRSETVIGNRYGAWQYLDHLALRSTSGGQELVALLA